MNKTDFDHIKQVHMSLQPKIIKIGSEDREMQDFLRSINFSIRMNPNATPLPMRNFFLQLQEHLEALTDVTTTYNHMISTLIEKEKEDEIS